MKALVAYCTVHGSTEGVAHRIGARLTKAGLPTDVRRMNEVVTVEQYDVAICGSAVHNQSWLPDAVEFFDRNTSSLLRIPVWLFSVCSVGETSSFFADRISGLIRRRRTDLKSVATIGSVPTIQEHRYFAGVIERTDWNLSGRFFLRLFGGTYGDHRDWDDIDNWTDQIIKRTCEEEAKGPLRTAISPDEEP